ncbi:MAG: PAS domain-containing protein, partial [Massilia sp.]
HLNYISGGIEALIGVSAQQLQENPGLLFNAVHEEDQAPFLRASRDASAAHSLFECDFRLRRPDGSLIWLRIRSAPRKVKGGWISRASMKWSRRCARPRRRPNGQSGPRQTFWPT